MAPKRGAKRAAAQEAPAAKRRQTADPAHGKALEVARALLAADAEVLPASTVSMLAPLAEVSLAIPRDQRHTFQASVVGMVDEALNSIKAHMERKLEEAKAKADGVYNDKAARQEACEHAKAALVELEDAIPPKKQALLSATEARDKALEELTVAQKAQKEGDKDCLATEARKAEVQKAVEALAVLKVTSDGSKQSKVAVKTVIDTGKDFGVDTTLLGPAPQVLRKEPEMRSDFDKVVIEQLEQAFASIVAGFDEILAAAAPAREERAAATQAAQKAAEEAEQVVATSAEELGAASQASKAGASAVKSAQKASERWLKDSKAVMDSFDRLSTQLASFTSGPLAAFEELKDLMPVPDPVEEAEAALPKLEAAEAAEAAPEAEVNASAASA